MRLLLALALLLAGPALAGPLSGKRVLHVDSYHPGNEWNDRIAAIVRKELEAQGVEVRIVHLDAKRLASEDERRASALRAKAEIETFNPDVVTTSDDDAAKYLLAPHYKGAALPVVFCGLNWDASIYGLPFANTTGMVEVSPIPQIVRLLAKHARGGRIGFLSEDTETKRKELEHHGKLFGIAYERIYLVRSMAEWTDAFRRAQGEVDMLVILGVGTLADWDVKAAAKIAEEGSRIPSGTDFEWLMPVSLVGVAKLPEEQGRWAARAALKILGGVPPSRIPLAHNREGELLFNARIAARLGIAERPPLAKLAP